MTDRALAQLIAENERLRAELARLLRTPVADLDTTLLVHPHVLLDFADYNDFLDPATADPRVANTQPRRSAIYFMLYADLGRLEADRQGTHRAAILDRDPPRRTVSRRPDSR